jgi:hypothetical protein
LQFTIWFGVPLLALIGMMWLAVWTYQAQRRAHSSKTTLFLWLTPLVVSGAVAFSTIATNFFVESPINNNGDLRVIILIGLVIFTGPPCAALAIMLWIAWRAAKY